MNEKLMRAAGFGVEMDAVTEGKYPFCKEPIQHNWRDELSRREFEISGLCQGCQDEMWEQDETCETWEQDEMVEEDDGQPSELDEWLDYDPNC